MRPFSARDQARLDQIATLWGRASTAEMAQAIGGKPAVVRNLASRAKSGGDSRFRVRCRRNATPLAAE
jgi:hypothetical protein